MGECKEHSATVQSRSGGDVSDFFHNFLRFFTTFRFGNKLSNKKLKKLDCILYVEINKKFPHKIVQKIDIKNGTRFFFNK